MKLAKKIIVGVLIATLAVGCFAFSSFAAQPQLSTVEIDDILEYHTKPVFFAEDYNADTKVFDYPNMTTNYVSSTSNAYTTVNSYETEFTRGRYPLTYEFVSEDTNQVLKVSNSTPGARKFSADYVVADVDTSRMYFELRFAMGAEDNTGFDMIFEIKSGRKSYGMFAIEAATEKVDDSPVTSANLKYSNFDLQFEDIFEYENELASLPITYDGSWYKIEMSIDLEKDVYSLTLTKESTNETVKTPDIAIFESLDQINEVTLEISDPKNTATDAKCAVMKFDDLFMYDGTFKRDVTDVDNTTSRVISELDAIAKHPDTADTVKFEIADTLVALCFDQTVGINYRPTPGVTENAAAVQEIIDNVMTFVNTTYADAIKEKASEIAAVEGYYQKLGKLEIIEGIVPFFCDEYGVLLSRDSIAALEGLNTDYADKVISAMEIISAEKNAIQKIDVDSKAFVRLVMNLDEDNNEYSYIADQINAIELLTHVDGTYDYNRETGESTDFETVADAIAIYDALKAKKAAIDKNIGDFIAGVDALPEVPVVTENFVNIKANFEKATKALGDGEFYEDFDYGSYEFYYSVDIDSRIDKYEEYSRYIEIREAKSYEFVLVMDKAKNSTYYNMTLELLNQAQSYIPSADLNPLFNKAECTPESDVAEPEYPGVSEAIETYKALRAKLTANVQNANAYIAAVNAIDMNAQYSILKTAVTNAENLKASGYVVGIAGVEAATGKLAEASAKINYAENCSATLVNSVKELKELSDIAERRKLIFIANGVVEGAEDSITGVSDAKATLTAEIARYNSDIEAANDIFSAATVGAVSVSSYSALDALATRFIEIVKLFFN